MRLITGEAEVVRHSACESKWYLKCLEPEMASDVANETVCVVEYDPAVGLP